MAILVSIPDDVRHQKRALFRRPLLVIAGFPRTGTTTLFENLARHPGFARGLRKELDYFRHGRKPSAVEYESLFAEWAPGQICLDATPYYALDPAIAFQVQALAPDARVVVLLREPAAWLFSFYAQLASCRPHAPDFATFARGGMADTGMEGMPARSFSGGLYAESVEAFEAAFGSRLLLLDYAFVKSDFLGAVRTIEAFAGALPWFGAHNVDAQFYNSSAAASQSSPLIRYLVSRQWFIRLASRLFPVRLIEHARAHLFLRPRQGAGETAMSAADAALARSLMRDSAEFYQSLFAAGPVRQGRDGWV